MTSLLPVIAVLLALIAAGSVAYLAWELTSEQFHKELEGGGREGGSPGDKSSANNNPADGADETADAGRRE